MKTNVAELSDAAVSKIEALAQATFPRVLPAEWRMSREAFINAAWFASADGLKVCCEVEIHGEHGAWLHVSFSRRDRDPSYFDMTRVKRLFVGRDRKAVQVLPAESEHFNMHKHCLHMWSPLERDPLPDFRREDGGL